MCDSGKIFPKYEVCSIEIDRWLFRIINSMGLTLYQVAVALAKRSFQDIAKKIDEMGPMKGCTATGDAINRAVQHHETMGRLQVDRVVIIVTDGQSDDDVIEPARQAREKGKLDIFQFSPFYAHNIESLARSYTVYLESPKRNKARYGSHRKV